MTFQLCDQANCDFAADASRRGEPVVLEREVILFQTLVAEHGVAMRVQLNSMAGDVMQHVIFRRHAIDWTKCLALRQMLM